MGNPADHMANERTYLAWIRTSIGLMAFGFVVEKFALFMKQLTLFLGNEGSNTISANHGLSSISGILLVSIGILVGLLAYINYKVTQKQIDKGNYQSSSLLPIMLTMILVLLGITLISILILSPHL